MHDFQSVEAELIECVSLWRRSPKEGRGGSGGYATDGLWHLITPEHSSDDPPRPAALSAKEVTRRDAVTSWLDVVPDGRDRGLVWAVVDQYEAGREQVDWHDVMRRMHLRHGRGGLRRRYERAIHAICLAVNAGTLKWVR